MLPGFKPAPAKFVSQLAKESEFEPEPAYIRGFELGGRALRNRRRGELALACATGGAVALFFAAVAGLALTSLTGFVVSLVAIFVAVLAIAGLGLWYLWDAKMSELESRQLVSGNEQSVKVLDFPTEEPQQLEKSA
jgi:hypothetical protein